MLIYCCIFRYIITLYTEPYEPLPSFSWISKRVRGSSGWMAIPSFVCSRVTLMMGLLFMMMMIIIILLVPLLYTLYSVVHFLFFGASPSSLLSILLRSQVRTSSSLIILLSSPLLSSPLLSSSLLFSCPYLFLLLCGVVVVLFVKFVVMWLNLDLFFLCLSAQAAREGMSLPPLSYSTSSFHHLVTLQV